MPLLKELITIPERVHQGDFVLKLSEGVTDAERTLRDYVVTPQLVDSFDDALGFIQQAVQGGHSNAAFLHGSFGAGKSHFMAVLHLLLAGDTRARALPELAGVVARHGWTEGKRFLLVPYHMIGARDMESAVLGQYADFVRQRHPEAPVPGFYLAEGLFNDAGRMREQLGDAAFFAKLNEGTAGAQGGGSGWGDLAGGWDAGSFAAAMLEPPNGEERARLVGDLIASYFSSYQTLAEARGEAFVALDAGLGIMSRHARSLGYDAVILFLDELVLWLASHAADVQFVTREGTKLVKLVEATHAERPAPLVSFVARQRDLRDLVGENLAGAVQVQFSDVMRHWEARFHQIKLEDRNLPAIAEKRVLRPVSEAARQAVQQACDEVLNVRQDVLATLLTTTADRAMFRQVYPFSPALVQTLIAVSEALQRERTALKLMVQLLVDRRDDLQLGQLIPVGDLYDAVAEGDEPFSADMRIYFEDAKRLYNRKLLPMLERQHGVTWEALRLGQAEPVAGRNLRNDARLLKTLLLAALVPQVEALRALTPARLAALNHGTIQSPIPGREVQTVLRKCREWAAEVGEIKVTEDTPQLVSIQITGVDIEPILQAAATHDNFGNNRTRLRAELFEQLGIQDTGELFTRYEFSWRGTRREVEIVFENVREMSDERLRGRVGTWTVVIDFPFDDGYGAQDDLARLREYHGGETRTLVWLPSFLGARARRDLGRLVVLDYILSGERFASYAGNLSYVDRVQAQALASNQRDQLRLRLRSQLEAAYGVSSETGDVLDNPLTPDQQLHSLAPTFEPRPPVGANLKQAFEQLLGQVFAHQYPAHPDFDGEIQPRRVRGVWQEVENAAQARDGRWHVTDAAARRTVRAIVNPLRIGVMGETHLLLDGHWKAHFAQCQARDGVAELTVGTLRRWIDEPRPMGLPAELQNLVILAFAAQTSRRFLLRGGPADATVEHLPDELVLREQVLPPAAHWQGALQRAGKLFGIALPELLNAANVGKLAAEVRTRAQAGTAAAQAYVAALTDKADRFAEDGGERLQTARSAQELLATLAAAPDQDIVVSLAGATLRTSEAALMHAAGSAAKLAEVLNSTRWGLFEGLRTLRDAREAEARRLLQRLSEALRADEHVVPIRLRLAELEQEAIALLAATGVTPAATTPAPAITPAPTPAPTAAGLTLVAERTFTELAPSQARAELDALRSQLVHDDELVLSLSWRLLRKGVQR